ncbi:MAG: VOC family protein [Rhodospirillaceae bacterium]|nr:VOC family protein [Rhodospirillaceae bacterium]
MMQALSLDTSLALKRVPIVVSDMEKSLKVYRDILGLTVESDNMMKPNAHDERVFNVPPGGLTRSVKFNIRPDQIRALGLFEVKDYKGKGSSGVHDHGVVFRVDRIDDIHAKLKAGGYRIIDFVDLLTAAGDKGRELAFLDPDGHLVLVYQLDQAANK